VRRRSDGVSGEPLQRFLHSRAHWKHIRFVFNLSFCFSFFFFSSSSPLADSPPTPHLAVDSDGSGRLGDSIENDLMGIHTPLYAPQLRAKFDSDDGDGNADLTALRQKLQPEVVVFGCVLYEMAVGEPIAVEDVNSCRDLPRTVPAPVARMLKGIFRHTTADAAGAADSEGDTPAAFWTLEQLAGDELFDEVELFSSWVPRVPEFAPEVQRYLRRLVRAPVLERLKAPAPSASQRTATSSPRPRSTRPGSSSSAGAAASPDSRTASAAAPVAPAAPPAAPAAPAAPAPPAAGPPPPKAELPSGAASSGRGALLASIRKGKGLKKAKTNDRSGPKV
jgi:WH2 motif